MCSFYNKMIQQLRENQSVFSLMASMSSFYIYEYRNPVAALIAIYDYSHSQFFKRHASLTKQIVLANYLDAAKKELRQLQLDKAATNMSYGEMSVVLDYRSRLERFHQTNISLAKAKIELYKIFLQTQVNFKVVIKMGQDIN